MKPFYFHAMSIKSLRTIMWAEFDSLSEIDNAINDMYEEFKDCEIIYTKFMRHEIFGNAPKLLGTVY